MSNWDYEDLKKLELDVDKKDITFHINENLPIHLNETFKQACRKNDYQIMAAILESNHNGFWEYCIFNWGLRMSCSEINIHSIEYMLSKVYIEEDEYNYGFLSEAIRRNNKFVLTYLTTVNPYLTFVSYDEQKYYYVARNDILFAILKKKAQIIQQWWKSIYYNPRHRICIERLSNQYDSFI